MISITSNIEDVIADLHRVEKVTKDVFQQHVLSPGHYVSEMERIASEICGKPVKLSVFVSRDSTTFSAESGEKGFADVKPGDAGFRTMEEFRNDIIDWVREQKEKKERDYYKGRDANAIIPGRRPGEPMSDARIADRIIGTMMKQPQLWFTSQNEDGLLHYLLEKNPQGLAEALGLTTQGGAILADLMPRVLDAWAEFAEPRMVDEGLRVIDAALGQ